MDKAYTTKNSQHPPHPTMVVTTTTATTAVPRVAATEKAPDGEWKKVNGRMNTNTPSPQKQDVPSPKNQRQPQKRRKEAQEQPNARKTGKTVTKAGGDTKG